MSNINKKTQPKVEELKKNATQKELNTYLDDIIAKSEEGNSNFINLTSENAKFIVKNFDSTDRHTKKFDTQIFTAEVLDTTTKTWSQKDFICPKALKTRFENLKKELKNEFHDMIFLVKYNGLVDSTKSKNKIHSFFVKNLSLTDSE